MTSTHVLLADSDSAVAMPRPTKKRRMTTNVISLPDDIYSIVLAMLHPREQYRLAFTCKSIRRLITHDMVIQSSIQHGGWAERTCCSVLQLVRQRTIFIPSPLRLLRLVNGRRCEASCCSSSNKNSSRMVHYTKINTLGAFLCKDCAKARCTSISISAGHAQASSSGAAVTSILQHDRVARTSQRGKSGIYLWTRHHSTANGELYGPLVTVSDVQVMLDSNQTSVDSFLQSSPLIPPHEHYKEFRSVLLKVFDVALQSKRSSPLELDLVVKPNVPLPHSRHDVDAHSIDAALKAMMAYTRYRHEQANVSPLLLSEQLNEMKRNEQYRAQLQQYEDHQWTKEGLPLAL